VALASFSPKYTSLDWHMSASAAKGGHVRENGLTSIASTSEHGPTGSGQPGNRGRDFRAHVDRHRRLSARRPRSGTVHLAEEGPHVRDPCVDKLNLLPFDEARRHHHLVAAAKVPEYRLRPAP
jgi:hypothetical protein